MTSKQDEIAISVKSVSKDFVLPHQNSPSTIKSLFINPFTSVKSKTTEKQHALKDISFDVKKGEFFGIVGRNGSGKSTLLKIIAGIYKPNKGSVNINGRLVPFIELGVGFNPELTGRENVYLSGALMGFSSNDVDSKYKDIVEFAELKRFMDQKLKNYSSGMQVRLAFSVATVLADSDILLIDEVLAVGDADFQRKCFEYFKKLKKDKKTVVFVSHDMSAVREYCDRAALIDNNKIVGIDTPDEIANKYNRLFIGNNIDSKNSKKVSRWGEGNIVTESIKVDVSEEAISITQIIKSYINSSNVIVGFRIKDSTGKEILGTNTKLERVKIGKIKSEQKIKIIWRLSNILSDGRYTVDPAVVGEDEVTISDWWDDAVEISIRKDKRLPYAIDPGYKLEVKK